MQSLDEASAAPPETTNGAQHCGTQLDAFNIKLEIMEAR
jgi:hypothetical protein